MSVALIQTTVKPIYAKSLKEFNEYVEKYKAPYEMVLTKGNNIAQSNYRNMPCCKTWKRGNHMEFHYLSGKEHIRVIYAIHYDEQSTINEKASYHAINYFKGLLDQIPTDDNEQDTEIFTCDSNPTSAYYNYVNGRYTDITIDHCYSLDRNNSFPASMAEVYPQTKPWVDKYYKERLINKQLYKEGIISKEYWEEFKLYGSIMVGWFKNPKYHRERAWKKIISNSNRKVHELREYIESQGNTVLLINTDAVKFIGHVDYEESTDLGQFKYEWMDTEMYIKGVKSYAYKDNGKWKFKQAGKCKLDRLKPDRDTWTLEEFIDGVDGQISVIKIKDNKLIEVFE